MDQNQDSIDQIESSNKHETKIPRTSNKENNIYIYIYIYIYDQEYI